jgi:hypothetical protein
VKVLLPRTFRVVGRLVDGHGTPAASGRVQATHGTRFGTFDLKPDGSFDLDLQPGEPYKLEFASPHTAVARVPVEKGESGELRDIGDVVTPASAIVTGRLVHDGDRSPVQGARVWLPRPSPNGPLMAWAFRDIIETSSGANGEFELTGAPELPFELRIEAPGLAPQRKAVTPDSNSHETDIGEIRLVGGTTVTVSIDGPSEGEIVAHVDPGGRGLPMDVMKAGFVEGRATVPNVPAGPAIVSAWRGKEMLCRQEISVPSSRRDVDVVCTARKVLVSGHVDVGGKRAGSGMLVWMTRSLTDVPTGIFNYGSENMVQQHVYSPEQQRASADVGPDGSFQVRLLAGTWEVLWMPERGRVFAPRLVQVPDTVAHEVALQYNGLSVQGIVLDRDRKPVKEANVRDLGGRGFAMTRGDGTFTLSGPDAGTWKLQASWRGETSSIVERVVQDGREPAPVELVLGGSDRTVRVVIKGASATAIAFLETDGGALDVTSADSSGTAVFKLHDPLPQRIRAGAAAPAGWTFGDWIPIGDAVAHDAQLSVGPCGNIVVRSKSRADNVAITRADGWRVDRLLQWLGTFPRVSAGAELVVNALPVGSYTVVLGQEQRTVSVEEGKSVDVSFGN